MNITEFTSQLKVQQARAADVQAEHHLASMLRATADLFATMTGWLKPATKAGVVKVTRVTQDPPAIQITDGVSRVTLRKNNLVGDATATVSMLCGSFCQVFQLDLATGQWMIPPGLARPEAIPLTEDAFLAMLLEQFRDDY